MNETHAPTSDGQPRSNAPPLAEQIAIEIEAPKAAAEGLLKSYGQSAITDDASAAELRRLAEQMRAQEMILTGMRTARAAPFETNLSTVKSAFDGTIRKLKDARSSIRTALNQYVQRRDAAAAAERARLAAEKDDALARAADKREEATRLGSSGAQLEALQADEQAEKLGRQADAIRPEPIRTDLGSVGSLRRIEFEITDLSACIRGLMRDPAHKSQIREAIAEIIKSKLAAIGIDHVEAADIPGVRAFVGKSATLASR